MNPHWLKCWPSALYIRMPQARELCPYKNQSWGASFTVEKMQTLRENFPWSCSHHIRRKNFLQGLSLGSLSLWDCSQLCVRPSGLDWMLWPCGAFQPRTLSQTHILSSAQMLPSSKTALPEFSHSWAPSVLPVQTCSLRGKVLKISWFHIQRGSSWVTHTVKNLPAMQETWVQSVGSEDPLEKGVATHSSILA